MLIELKIKRPGGSHVTMPVHNAADTAYHFAPRADGAHVADVTDADHIARFLAIPEYRPYQGAVAPALTVAPPVSPVAMTGDELIAARLAEAAEQGRAAMADVKGAAESAAAAVPSADDAQAIAAQAALAADEIAAATTQTQAQAQVEPVAMEAMSLAELQDLFQAETGDRAHPRAKPETLIAKINEARAAKAQV